MNIQKKRSEIERGSEKKLCEEEKGKHREEREKPIFFWVSSPTPGSHLGCAYHILGEE